MRERDIPAWCCKDGEEGGHFCFSGDLMLFSFRAKAGFSTSEAMTKVWASVPCS